MRTRSGTRGVERKFWSFFAFYLIGWLFGCAVGMGERKASTVTSKGKLLSPAWFAAANFRNIGGVRRLLNGKQLENLASI